MDDLSLDHERRPEAVPRPLHVPGRGVLIETYLIDHEEDLYGTMLRVAFVERLRGEKRFRGGRGVDHPDANGCASFTPRSSAKEQKSELIGNRPRQGKDTGSAEVQVALMTERIKQLTKHLRTPKTTTGARAC